MRRIRVLVFDPDSASAISWYRGIGVWTDMAKRFREELEVTYRTMPPEWFQIAAHDVLVMIRPYREEHLNTLKTAEYYKVPVWCDYDDDLFSLTADNPSKPVYEKPSVRAQIRSIINRAHIVTLSTHQLRAVWEPAFPNATFHVIRNAHDPRTQPLKGKKPGKKRSVVWRGLNSHQYDLAHHQEAIISLAKANEDVVWLFLGTEPFFIDQIKNHSILRPQELPIYFETLGALSCSIGIVPLRETRFNMCKSNIAAMEMSMLADAACLVPAWEEWRVPGVTTYNSQAEFHRQLSLMLEAFPEDLAAVAKKTQEYFRTDGGLKKANEERFLLLKGMCE